MNEQTYREHLNDLQVEIEALRAKLKEAQTGDLISRQAAIDALDGVSWMHLEGKHEICDGDWIKADEAEEALKQLPSAQPEITQKDVELYCRQRCLSVITNELFNEMKARWAGDEIIRCKDCKHGVDYYHDGECYCSHPKHGLMYFGGSWSFYCADAERREE